jgi:hypothetical protein
LNLGHRERFLSLALEKAANLAKKAGLCKRSLMPRGRPRLGFWLAAGPTEVGSAPTRNRPDGTPRVLKKRDAFRRLETTYMETETCPWSDLLDALGGPSARTSRISLASD